MHKATLGEGDPSPGSGPETGRSTPARGQPRGRVRAAAGQGTGGRLSSRDQDGR